MSPEGMFGEGRARPVLGVVEWFRPGEEARVEAAVEGMRRLGIRHLRTGVSWADCHTTEGRRFYDWLLPRLGDAFELLPCFTYTPPSLGVVPKTAAPPRQPKDYADFIDVMITRHGAHFDAVELWNEPNNVNDWDWRLDPQWTIFAEMIVKASHWARRRGKRTVLGGMCPTDPNWLAHLAARGALGDIDVVGVHAFPGTWQSEWQGWAGEIAAVRDALARHGASPEIWITETGYSTWRHDEMRQVEQFAELAEAPVERAYWYAWQDLAPELECQEGFHFDERHYHLGILRADGTPKLLARALEQGGPGAARAWSAFQSPPAIKRRRDHAVITGGAGFVGSNLADRLAAEGRPVLIYDTLGRPGVEQNLEWLRERHGNRIAAEIADIRDPYTLRHAVADAAEVYHLAAQVAVTTSLADPIADFEVNARGTINLLEALRLRPSPPPLVFASTNKVYGKLDDLSFDEAETRYEPADPVVKSRGIDERRALDLHSPYGCSKGAADQYVIDYARVFGLPAVVLRMSCLYGPRQFGTEDQGWVAHFLISALRDRPITIYGTGKQVRDILYVADAVEAYRLAQARMADIGGRAFNLGGGPANAVSLIEVLQLITRIHNRQPRVEHGPWRAGDQAYYVSDTSAFQAATGWRPTVPAETGVQRLFDWLRRREAPRAVAEELSA